MLRQIHCTAAKPKKIALALSKVRVYSSTRLYHADGKRDAKQMGRDTNGTRQSTNPANLREFPKKKHENIK